MSLQIRIFPRKFDKTLKFQMIFKRISFVSLLSNVIPSLYNNKDKIFYLLILGTLLNEKIISFFILYCHHRDKRLSYLLILSRIDNAHKL